MNLQPLTRERLWTKDYIILIISNFLMFVSLQMLLPTFPVYVEQMGGNELEVGLAVSLFAAAALLVRPISGILLDTIGRRLVLLTGLVCLIIFSFQYFWITSILIILIIRIAHGISWGVATTGMSTTSADLVPKSRRGEGLGYFGMSITLSLAIAPYLGLWIYERFGFTWMFIVSSLSAVLSLILTSFIRFSTHNIVKPTEQEARPKFSDRIFERRALMPALLVFLFTSAYSAVEVYIAMFTTERGIPSAGPFFIVLAIAMFAVRPISGRIYDRFGVRPIVIAGIAISMGGILLLSLSNTTTLMLIAGAICGAGMSAVMPSMQAWNVDRAPAGRLGASSGTYMSGIDLGFSFGTMINATVAGWTSYTTMYQFITLYLVIFVIIFIPYTRKQRQEEQSNLQA